MNDTPDYTSRVPHYTFADTLEEQEASAQNQSADAPANRVA